MSTILDEIRTKFTENFDAVRIEEGDDENTFIFIFPKPDYKSEYPYIAHNIRIKQVRSAGYGVHYVGRSWYLGDSSEYGIIVRFGE